MIATVASSSSQYHHTINTLKYADRVGNEHTEAFELSWSSLRCFENLPPCTAFHCPPCQLLPAQQTHWAPSNIDASCQSHLGASPKTLKP